MSNPHEDDDKLMRAGLEESRELPKSGSAQDPDAPLDAREQKFIQAFLRHGNRTQAAREAGYPRPASHVAQLLRRPNVAKAIREAMEAAAANRGRLSREHLLQRLEVMLKDGPLSIGVHHERVRIIELYAKIQGWLTPKMALERKGGSPYTALADTLRRHGAEFTEDERESLRKNLEIDIVQAQECLALLGVELLPTPPSKVN